nr:MAG TPA: DNA repair photolyase [Caudoviricetes sp.]
MKPLYIPKGKAKEYGDYAVNIYTGCPHRCYYCFAPNVLHRDRETFHTRVEPRPGLVEALKRQLEKEQIKDKIIHLCFTCDPYPVGYDSTVTREVIRVIKESGNHVQILTKGDGGRDFDLLDGKDWYGITYDGSDTGRYDQRYRLLDLEQAKECGISTWVSCEPVLDPDMVLTMLSRWYEMIDKVKIGKLNYHSIDIDWKSFGKAAEQLCQNLGINYYIKESLRKEMEGRP